jgi:hypothetical protein
MIRIDVSLLLQHLGLLLLDTVLANSSPFVLIRRDSNLINCFDIVTINKAYMIKNPES